MKLFLLALAVGVISSGTSAVAQGGFQPNWAAWGSANLGMNTLARQQAQLQGRNPDAPLHPFVSTYRVNPSVTGKVVADYVASFQKTLGPQKAAVLQAELLHMDIERAWGQDNAGEGARTGDVVDAFAVYLLLNWHIATGGSITPAGFAAVRAQTRRILVNSVRFQQVSEAERQMAAETYMVNALAEHRALNDAERNNNPALRQQLAQAAELRGRNAFHLDLQHEVLTSAGLVPAGTRR